MQNGARERRDGVLTKSLRKNTLEKSRKQKMMLCLLFYKTERQGVRVWKLGQGAIAERPSITVAAKDTGFWYAVCMHTPL